MQSKLLSRSMIWTVLGTVLILGLVGIVGLALMGPAVGGVFSSVISSLPPSALPDVISSSGYAAQPPLGRLIIREGRISMVVTDTLAAKTTIEQVIGQLQGEEAFVVSSTEIGGVEGRSPAIMMIVRVPAARFDSVMDSLAGMAAEISERTETAQDVTDEYVDVQARLQALETARARLLEILENAETTDAVLQAEQQLTQREADIEALQGRVQYLTQSARLSEISIVLQPSVLSQPIESGWRPAETARRGYEALLKSVQGFGNTLIYFSIAVLPWLVFGGLIAYVAIRVVRRYFAARSPKPGSLPPTESK